MMNLAALVGPTAVGKTEISLLLARTLNAEIISCDSMQVYRGMDIGTAKTGLQERTIVPHHLLDIVDPDVNFTVADYKKMAQDSIRDIAGRGKLPLLVGGTGLYYQAVVDNYDFFPIEAQDATRRKWEKELLKVGLDNLYQRLQLIDKDYADKIGPNDKKRIIRGLEVFDLTGRPFSSLQNRNRGFYNLCAIGLFMDREDLYRRIENRVDRMIEQGLIDEVKQLMEKGYDLSCNAMQALGYKQVFYYLQGYLSYEEMIRDIKKETRRFAKRQFTWFNKDKRIKWINVSDFSSSNELTDIVSKMIRGQLFEM
jgi:tRNA dimethylallyltransferase